jgi:hypothetical protein
MAAKAAAAQAAPSTDDDDLSSTTSTTTDDDHRDDEWTNGQGVPASVPVAMGDGDAAAEEGVLGNDGQTDIGLDPVVDGDGDETAEGSSTDNYPAHPGPQPLAVGDGDEAAEGDVLSNNNAQADADAEPAAATADGGDPVQERASENDSPADSDQQPVATGGVGEAGDHESPERTAQNETGAAGSGEGGERGADQEDVREDEEGYDGGVDDDDNDDAYFTPPSRDEGAESERANNERERVDLEYEFSDAAGSKSRTKGKETVVEPTTEPSRRGDQREEPVVAESSTMAEARAAAMAAAAGEPGPAPSSSTQPRYQLVVQDREALAQLGADLGQLVPAMLAVLGPIQRLVGMGINLQHDILRLKGEQPDPAQRSTGQHQEGSAGQNSAFQQPQQRSGAPASSNVTQGHQTRAAQHQRRNAGSSGGRNLQSDGTRSGGLASASQSSTSAGFSFASAIAPAIRGRADSAPLPLRFGSFPPANQDPSPSPSFLQGLGSVREEDYPTQRPSSSQDPGSDGQPGQTSSGDTSHGRRASLFPSHFRDVFQRQDGSSNHSVENQMQPTTSSKD